MEELYMVVLTNKQSNILEDLETLHILTKLVPEYCRSINEKVVCEKSFELIFAFDEVIAMGYKEKVTISQIKSFTEMDSQEEKIADMVERNKEREAKENAKRRLKEIERERREREKMGLAPLGGIGAGQFNKFGQGNSPHSGGYSQQPFIVDQRKGDSPSLDKKYTTPDSSRQAPVVQGLSLKKTPKANTILEKLKAEGELVDAGDSASPKAEHVHQKAPGVMREDVNIEIEEKILIKADRDGSVHKLEVRGELVLTITKEEHKCLFLQMQKVEDKSIQIKTHPNIDRPRFAKDGILCPKDAKKAHSVNTPTPLLKWRYQSSQDDQMPLTINCWPSTSKEGVTIVNLEYELGQGREWELNDVSIRIPVAGKEKPMVNSIDSGTYEFDVKDSILCWNLPIIEQSNSSGAMEFELALWNKENTATSFLFPITVTFTSTKTYFSNQILGCLSAEGGQPVKYSQSRNLTVESFTIEDSGGSF